MNDTETVTCWDCNGTGIRCPAAGNTSFRDIPCDRCGETGTVPAYMRQWAEWGELIRNRRRAMEFGLMDWAKMNGYDLVALSRAERGILDPRQFHGPCAGPPPEEFKTDQQP